MKSRFESVFSHFVSPEAEARPDERRRARLIVAFSLLGAFFGSMFGGFYILIGHYWGGAIIGVCCVLFGLVPGLLRNKVSTGRAGNHYCLVLLGGFLSLCWVEGGIHGHAVAWLVTIPLCALILTSPRGAYFWSAMSFIAALATCGVEAFGVSPPIRYPMEWHVFVSTMGYSALVLFLFALGLVFETGRRTAHNQMQALLTKLAAANERLTILNQEKSEFLGIAAHDLKSPLTAIMGYSDMLTLDRITTEQVKKAGSIIGKSAQRMRHLISDLLDLNAIEEGKMNLDCKPVPIAEATEALLENQIVMAARKNITLRVQITSNATALADEKALLQIVDNLLSNAIKFTKPGGRAGFDCWEDFESVWIKISDTGPGISAEDQARMFGRFTRLSARPTGGESSHGLGLSIVKRLIDAMKGEIRCESVIGRGAAFILKLPKTTAPEKSSPLPSAPPPEPAVLRPMG